MEKGGEVRGELRGCEGVVTGKLRGGEGGVAS